MWNADLFGRSKVQLAILYVGLIASGAACTARAPKVSNVAQAPSAPGAELYAVGLTFLHASDLTRAEQYFASALEQGYEERACVRALVVTTVRASRLRSALTYAAPQLARHPNDVPLRQLVATILFVLDELSDAERELGRVLVLEESRAEAHYLLALVRARRGAPPQERRAPLQRYLELAPDGPHAEEVRAGLRELAEAHVPVRRHPNLARARPRALQRSVALGPGIDDRGAQP